MEKGKELKENILKLTKQYYEIVHKPEQDKIFLPGKSKINYAGRVFDEKEMENLIESGLDFWLTFGKYSTEIEKKFSEFLRIRWSFLVNSGSSANLLAFFALSSHLLKEKRIKKGEEVITVAAGFPTTISPIIQYGAIPVFLDIDPRTLNIDTSQLQKALTSKTKAIMIAHTLGNPANIRAIKQFCDENKLWFIEDNCDALGSLYDGKLTGTWGDIGTSSFYPPHHMTMGEGGMTYTNSSRLKKIMLSLRDWGRDCWCESGVDNTCGVRFSGSHGSLPKGYDHKYVYSHFGFNLKATDMQAAIGVAQIDKVPKFIKARKNNYELLKKGLSHMSDYITFQEPTENSDPSWFGFFIMLKDNVKFKRNQLTTFLEENKIQTRNLFAGNIIKHPAFKILQENRDYRVVGNLKNTNKVMENSFWIGLYPGMQNEEIEYMIDKISYFVVKNK